MLKTFAFLLASTVALGQQLSFAGPLNATPNGATIQIVFTANSTAGAAGFQFILPAGMSVPVQNPQFTSKKIACSSIPRTDLNGGRLCTVLDFNDDLIATALVATSAITTSGTYGATGVVGSSPTGTDIGMTATAPLVVQLPRSRCDTNGDGETTQADWELLRKYLQDGSSATPNGTVLDINKNGTFNNGDVQLLGRVARGVVACPE